MRDLDRIFSEAAEAGRRAATPLPPAQIRGVAASVRRVRAATTTVLSAVVVTAVVIIVTTAGVPNAAPDYVESPAPAETTTSTSAPPTSPPPTTEPPTTDQPPPPILDGGLLTVDDLETLGGGRIWLKDDGETDALCAPDVGVGAAETAHVRYRSDVGLVGLDQWAEAFAGSNEAAARLLEIRSFFGDCAEEQGDDVDLFWGFTLDGLGDTGFVHVMWQPLNEVGYEDEVLYVVVRAAQTGRVVTWLVSTGPGQDFNQRPGLEPLIPAVDLLCEPAGGACAGDPVLTQSYPNHDGVPGPGLPSAADVDAVIPGRWRSGPVYDDPLAGGGSGCEPLGTAGYLKRLYQDEDFDVPQLTIVRVDLGTEAAADAFIAAQETSPTCLGEVALFDRVPGEFVAWRSNWSDTEYSYTGFVQAGSRIAMARWSFSSGDDDKFIDLLDVAETRLAELE